MADIDIDIDDLKAGLAAGTHVVVDVREAHEYAAGRIPGSLPMPLSAFDPRALPAPGGRTIVLSCQASKRSAFARDIAQKAGRADIVAHYPGGFGEWRALGEKVETGIA